MTSIMSTMSAYFRTHHGNETRTYFLFFIYFTYVEKQRSKKHVPWKAPLMLSMVRVLIRKLYVPNTRRERFLY